MRACFAPNYDWHLVLQSWEVTSGIGCRLQRLAVEDPFHRAHTFIETVRVVRRPRIGIIGGLILLALQVDLILELEERHHVNDLIVIEATLESRTHG